MEYSLIQLSLKSKCPACAKGDIYSGLLDVAKKCNHCGLNLQDHDAGDGPAFFVMFIVGISVTLMALIAEFTIGMNLWMHAIIWSMVAIIKSVLLLRIAKSALIAIEYRKEIVDSKIKK